MTDWGVPLAVTGLVVATLVLAALHHRYQAHQARVHALVRRLERTLLAETDALSTLLGIRLSRELRVVVRADILARYRAIDRHYRRYPGVRQSIAAAERALKSEGESAAAGVGNIDSPERFRRLTGALDALEGIIASGETLTPIPADVRQRFRRELGERRAEVWARFHVVEAHRLEGIGDLTTARAHLTTLMQLLRRRGPRTAFVQALYAEAEQALGDMARRAFAPEPTSPAAGVRT